MAPSDQNKDVQLEERGQNNAQPEDAKANDVTRIETYNTKIGFVTGVLQICVWIVLLIFAIIIMSFGVYSDFTQYWITNFLPGVLYLVAGILGVLSRNQNRLVIIAYMVLSILSAVGAGSSAIVGGFSTWSAYYHCYRVGFDLPSWFDVYLCQEGEYGAIMAMIILSLITCLVELIIAIVAAWNCYKAVRSTPT